MRTEWEIDEMNFLKDLYVCSGMTLIELYPLFIKKYDRSKASLKVKIKRMKLRHSTDQTKEAKSRLNKGELNGMYGKVGPNKDKNKENSDRIKIASEKISLIRKEKYINGELQKLNGDKNPMFGKTPWNKGLTKYDDVRILNYGLKLSEKAKYRWCLLSEEQKVKRIGDLTECSNKMKKDTKIERIVEDVLRELEINYLKNYKNDRFIFDFYLPDIKYIIECQGDYWHANPIKYKDKELSKTQLSNIERDKRKMDFINSNDFNYIYLWENYILKYKKTLKNIINDDLTKNFNNIHI